MGEAPTDFILPVLVKIQEDAAAFRNEMLAFRKEVLTRFDKVDETTRAQRRDTAGMLVMMKGASGIFEERITKLEGRMDNVERRLDA